MTWRAKPTAKLSWGQHETRRVHATVGSGVFVRASWLAGKRFLVKWIEVISLRCASSQLPWSGGKRGRWRCGWGSSRSRSFRRMADPTLAGTEASIIYKPQFRPRSRDSRTPRYTYPMKGITRLLLPRISNCCFSLSLYRDPNQDRHRKIPRDGSCRRLQFSTLYVVEAFLDTGHCLVTWEESHGKRCRKFSFGTVCKANRRREHPASPHHL